MSIDNLATPFVCILSGFLQQRFGPRNVSINLYIKNATKDVGTLFLSQVLLFACLPYLFGWVFAAYALSVHALYLSRLLVGVSHALVTTTVYSVEVASKEMRATFSLWESVFR